MKSFHCLLIAGVGAAILAAGCDKPDGSDGVKSITQACAQDDLASKATLYFGPSNHIGPGSIWTRLGAGGGYQPRWRVEDLQIDSSVVAKGVGFTCNVGATSQFTADAGLSVLSKAAAVSAEVKADLARAKGIQVSADEVAWDTIIAGPYLNDINSIGDDRVKSDVLTDNRLVLRRELRLNGYKAILEFDTAVGPEIKGKYDGVTLGSQAVGEVGAQVKARWTSDDKLELSAAGEVYVAGEFAQLTNGELVATRGGESRLEDLGDKRILPYEGEP